MRQILLPLLIAAACAGAIIQSFANDTSASIDAGGLVFEKSTAIQIKSEVLYISPERVEVDYVFANPTTVDITTVVAFPLPHLNFAIDSPISIPFKGPQNFVGFRTWVDGTEIHMESDVHATLQDGRDVTSALQSLGLNIYERKLAEYAPELKGQLLNLGAFDDYHGRLISIWIVGTSFYWTQTFPAGKETHIKHAYSAGPFKSVVTENEAEWCTDDSYEAAFRKLPKRFTDYMEGAAVRYVLKTGANWAGPIGDFTLKLDKAGTALLSTCPIPGLSLKREGKVFVAHAKNYTPSSDLNVLFVRLPRTEQGN